MIPLDTVHSPVTICSVLRPKYAAPRPGFVSWCSFPGSPSKAQSEMMDTDMAPRHSYHLYSCYYQSWKSLLPCSQCVHILVEKEGGCGLGGLRKQAAENPTYLPRHSQHAVWLPRSTHIHILIKQRCGPTLVRHVCSHACLNVDKYWDSLHQKNNQWLFIHNY